MIFQMPQRFTFFSNRASALYETALTELGGRKFTQQDQRIDFLYFDGYGGKQAPECNEVGFTLIDRRLTIPLDNKSSMAKTLMRAGLKKPMTYFDVDSVPADHKGLWFVKNPLATAGKELYCVSRDEIAGCFQDGFIIQEAIDDLDVINGKKFTLRAYALVCRGSVYLYPEGVIVVHGKDFDPQDKSAESQYLHDGYMRADSPVKMLAFSDYQHYSTVLENLKLTVAMSFLPFRDKLLDGRDSTYCLFGVDILVESSLNTVLVEINDRPNLVHTQAINNHVSVPVIQAMMAVLDPNIGELGMRAPQRFVEVLRLPETVVSKPWL